MASLESVGALVDAIQASGRTTDRGSAYAYAMGMVSSYLDDALIERMTNDMKAGA